MFSFKVLITFIYLWLVVGVHMCHGTHEEVGGQLVGVSSLFQLVGPRELNSSYQAWQHVLLPANPSWHTVVLLTY